MISYYSDKALTVETTGRDVEMAAIAVYLASPASAYTNGQDIAVDGGFSLVNP